MGFLCTLLYLFGWRKASKTASKLYKEECTAEVYEFLAQYCEFLSHYLTDTWRIKDCPDDIYKEAISSLIFASARIKDLQPELLQIRKLVRECYGERFEAMALDLLPGNCVNSQIKDKIRDIFSAKKLPNVVTYRLLEGLTTTALPLISESTTEQHPQRANDNDNQYVLATVDFPANQLDFDHHANDKDQLMTHNADSESSSKNSTISEPEEIVYLDDIEDKKPEEIVHLDDIVEIKSPLRIGKTEIDQTLFVFRVAPVLENHKRHHHMVVKHIEEPEKCCRAISMPSKGSMRFEDDICIKRSRSVPVPPSPPHVHPKLPDYDELIAKFMACKKEH